MTVGFWIYPRLADESAGLINLFPEKSKIILFLEKDVVSCYKGVYYCYFSIPCHQSLSEENPHYKSKCKNELT